MKKPPHFQSKIAVARQLFCSPVVIEFAMKEAEFDLIGKAYQVAAHKAWDAAEAFSIETGRRYDRDLELYNQALDQAARDRKLPQQIYQLIKDGLTRCSDIAKAIGISNSFVSRIVTQLIKDKQVIKKGRDYKIA